MLLEVESTKSLFTWQKFAFCCFLHRLIYWKQIHSRTIKHTTRTDRNLIKFEIIWMDEKALFLHWPTRPLKILKFTKSGTVSRRITHIYVHHHYCACMNFAFSGCVPTFVVWARNLWSIFLDLIVRSHIGKKKTFKRI